MKWIVKTDKYDIATVWPPLLVVVATCWVVSLVVFAIAMVGLGYTTQLPRLVPMIGLESPDAYDPRLSVESDRERFRQELVPIVAKLDTTEAKVLAILEWVMNQIPKVQNRFAKSSWEMVELGRADVGLICSGMAQLFHDALITQGIPARRVLLQRNVFDVFDTHVTVEAFVDGKWRVYDPTFHVVLKANGAHIGAYEEQSWLQKRQGTNVEVKFLGDVRYPARIGVYPIRYEAHFDNVYVELKNSHGIVRAIPFISVWLGPQWAYQGDGAGLSTMAQDFYRFLYYATLVALPAINLVLLLAMVFLWRNERRLRR